MPSPFILDRSSVTQVMAWVLAALVPGIVTYVWLFGPGILVTLALATATALAAEAAMLKARGYPLKPFLTDLSAVVTAWLLALSLPSLAPWWLIVTGTLFAIVVAKHLYGGLGQNIFNPAMVGYAVLIVSFPVQMTHWAGPLELTSAHLSLAQSATAIFGGAPKATLDAVTMATPLDTLRTGLLQQLTVDEVMTKPIFGHYGGTGFEWLAVAFLAGGLALWALRIIGWQVPLAFLAGVWLTAGFLHFYDAGRYGAPWFHLFAPSVMLGAFFIATDPVTGATTPRGKLVFGLGAGFLTMAIRTWGGFPDGVAFAILLMNVAAPLIDQYTQPRVYGGGTEARK
ncbi:RnfABCDGE type electron transport complex subunit D [Thiobacillus sedimenti]|uniref:Ion-translocating oxidoreductase complex subunit D n=1 Tax=Thiobacillus sedimenti TaxID=3110231 RepID=A0ABZ1CH38_9PROT|nr:RnfABCDGE type electron transport complex subunit D [Thiobacillus sp. SCUT-2]WRS38542.1 RnfABCDGE type electron transport complex subunit D [Thiobacillus sp. SCUT-2]